MTKELLQHIVMDNEQRQELAGFLRCKYRLFIDEEGLIRLRFNGGRSCKSKGYTFGKNKRTT